VKLDPRLRKLIAFALIGTGALAVMSGVVNIIGAYKLIEDSDAASLGVSRNEIVGTYAVIALIGAALVFFGLRIKKPSK
jgi:hypothetical protein